MNKPKFPPCNYIEEGNIHFCECGSSQKLHFLFFPSGKCIQPNCENYYKGYPSEDTDTNLASFINGKYY